jgi:hypothetical protein
MQMRFAGAHFIISALTPISRRKEQMGWSGISRPDRLLQLRSRDLQEAGVVRQLRHQLRLRPLQPHPRLLRQQPQLRLPRPLRPRPQRLAQPRLRHRGLLQRQDRVRHRDLDPLLCLVRSWCWAPDGTRCLQRVGSITAPSQPDACAFGGEIRSSEKPIHLRLIVSPRRFGRIFFTFAAKT